VVPINKLLAKLDKRRVNAYLFLVLDLVITKRTDPKLLERMANHYSQPKGFVGRNICYAIFYNQIYYRHIVAGSATRFLPGRNEFLNIDLSKLNNIVNNIFFNVEKVEGKYPLRNFTTFVVKEFVKQATIDWEEKYKDKVIGFETLIEKPRTGELYMKAGWTKVGETIGYTCKRSAGKGSDNWSGKRVWNTNKEQLRPKNVFCFKVKE
jgi:hypothetical protein